MKIRALTIIATTLVLSACGGGGGDDEPETPLLNDACSVLGLPTRSLRIINGSECGSLASSPVVRVETLNQQTGESGICSGTMIAPDAVLTAAHCFLSSPTLVVAAVGEVSSPSIVRAQSVTLHPAFQIDETSATNDVAIIKLQSSLSLPTVGILASRSVREGEVLSIFGYGIDENGNTDDYDLRSGQVRVADVSEDHIQTNFDGTGSNTCQGDSGGPLLVTENGVAVLVGVTSSGSLEGCSVGDESLYTNLQSASVSSFILEQVPSVTLR